MNLEWDGIEQQIIDAERFHEELAEGFIHRSDGTIELVKEFEASLYFKGVLRLVEDAVVTTGQVSLLTTSSRGRSSIRFNRLGFDLYLACMQYVRGQAWQLREEADAGMHRRGDHPRMALPPRRSGGGNR